MIFEEKVELIRKEHIRAALLAVNKFMRGVEPADGSVGISVAQTIDVEGEFPVTVRFSFEIRPLSKSNEG